MSQCLHVPAVRQSNTTTLMTALDWIRKEQQRCRKQATERHRDPVFVLLKTGRHCPYTTTPELCTTTVFRKKQSFYMPQQAGRSCSEPVGYYTESSVSPEHHSPLLLLQSQGGIKKGEGCQPKSYVKTPNPTRKPKSVRG